MHRFYLGALYLVLPCVGSIAFAAPPQYTVIDLGNQEAGQGLVWQQLVATQVSYPGLGGSNVAYATNSAAEVGASNIPNGAAHAARWVPYTGGATFTDLGLLPNAFQFGRDPSSTAYGLNLSGDIVGQSDSQYTLQGDSPYHAQHAFLWNSGVMTDLGTIPGNGYESAAYSINDTREIVGWTNTVSSVDGTVLFRAFVYTGGMMYNLTFYEVGGAQYLLDNAWAIDCQGNIAASGYPATSTPPYPRHNYLLVRQGAARTGCVK
jgi:probable HAF family extracellular repeat protein